LVVVSGRIDLRALFAGRSVASEPDAVLKQRQRPHRGPRDHAVTVTGVPVAGLAQAADGDKILASRVTVHAI
jgi:hypothetical protein